MSVILYNWMQIKTALETFVIKSRAAAMAVALIVRSLVQHLKPRAII